MTLNKGKWLVLDKDHSQMLADEYIKQYVEHELEDIKNGQDAC